MSRGGNSVKRGRGGTSHRRGGSSRGGSSRGGSSRGGSSRGRGGAVRGRGGAVRGQKRQPFKSRDRLKSFSQQNAAKRKYEKEHEDSSKKFKTGSSDEEAEFSSESETDERPVDIHYMLMKTFAAGDEDNDDDDDQEENDDDTDEEDDDESIGEDVGSDEEEGGSEIEHSINNTHNSVDDESDQQEDDESDQQEDDESDQQEDDESDGQEDDESDEQDDESDDEQEDESDNHQEDKTDQIEETKNGEVETGGSSADRSQTDVSTSKKLHKSKKQQQNATNDGKEEEDTVPEQDDPFCCHFERSLSEDTAATVQDSSSWQQKCCIWEGLGILKHRYPQPTSTEGGRPKKLQLLQQSTQQQLQPTLAPTPTQPRLQNFDMSSLHIKENIQKSISTGLTDMQKHLLSMISNYTDVYYPESTYDEWDELTTVYCIHAANHILKTRARIMKNNAKLNKAKLKKTGVNMLQFQDQGYARPKVLFLLPSRHSAYRVVQGLASVLRLTGRQDVLNRRRFEEDYGPGDSADTISRAKKGRAADFVATFTGDTSDDFKIGLTLNKKSMKLYTSFYSSDIILSSPLGLRLTTGVEGEQDSDTGFLTSVEMLIMDQADIFLMQNWEHVLSVWDSINQPIKSVSEIQSDMDRVRRWLVEGHAPLYRQTILSSAINNDQLRALFARSKNFAGSLQVFQSSCEGVMSQVLANAELLLLRSPGLCDKEARLQYFTKELLPQHVASKKAYTLLFIPDYTDYFAINEYLSMERNIAFSSINEYMTRRMSNVAVARSDFFKGKSPLLLYTERFHFYKRPSIKGIRHLIFYDLPTYPHFFTEMCNMMLVSKQNRGASQQQKLIRPSITVIFQNSDVNKLVATLGTKSAKELLTSDKRVHMCTIAGR